MGSAFAKLFNRLASKNEIRILMTGLDAAGKTTILYKLKLGKIVTTVPTIGFAVESVQYKNVSLCACDVPSLVHLLVRRYCQDSQGLIFVVDSNDRDRIGEARDELWKLLNADESKDVVLLILANKKDFPNAMTSAEITDKLGLDSIFQLDWYIQRTCAISGEGLHQGLDMLTAQLAAKQFG
ncbi:hypothetical protein BSKO_02841 [Bryopsis sp. KO-2023]|nr:hypothetical protein BSKO_02841 [Bryopsis sp. KO-2023]